MSRETCKSLGVGLVLVGIVATFLASPSSLAKEQPAVMTTEESATVNEEGMIPASYIRGRISQQKARYLLGPGDKISIKIRDLDEYNQEFSIRPDGFATIHPFGEMNIAGTDIQGLESWLEEKFRFYLVEPEVSVDIEEMRPAIIYITGAVQQPGTYQFIRQGENNATLAHPAQEKVEIILTNVLSKAGGVTEKADIANITVIHQSTNEKEHYNLRELLISKQAGDIWLLPGDRVIVPEMDLPMDPETFKLVSRSTYYQKKFPVLVLGAVNKQGEVQVDPNNNSLNAALALAGGFIPAFSEDDKVIIQRPGNNGGYSRWTVDPRKAQLELMPGDVVYVHSSKLAKLERGINILGKLTAPVFHSGAGLAQFKNLSD